VHRTAQEIEQRCAVALREGQPSDSGKGDALPGKQGGLKGI